MRSLVGGRRTSLRAVLVAGVVGASLLFTGVTPANAFVKPPIFVTVPAVEEGTVGVLAPEGSLITGAFMGGFWLGHDVIGPAIFGKWLTPSIDRQVVLHKGFELPGWSFNPGTNFCTPVASTPVATSGLTCGSKTWQLWNQSGASATVTMTAKCMAKATGITYVVMNVGGTVLANNGTVTGPNVSCTGTDVVSEVLFKRSDGVEIMRWIYEPPGIGALPWNITTTTTCLDGSGSIAATLTTTTTLNPVAGGDLTIPAGNCAQAVVDGHVGSVTVTGGRGTNTDPILSASPWTPAAVAAYPLCTSQATGTGCDLVPKLGTVSCFLTGSSAVDCGGWYDKPNTFCWWGPYAVPRAWCLSAYEAFLSQTTTIDPSTTQPSPGPTPSASASAVPGTLGTGSSVSNPDGSVTETQTQTLPDGNIRTVVTTTYPDGSKSIVTNVTTPAGVPVGTPTTVTLPPTRPTTEGQTDDGCSFGLRPWLWPYRALKCAFVPNQAALDELTSAATVTDTVPFSWIGDMQGFVSSALGASTHCIQWGATVGPFGHVNMLDTCTPGPVEGIIMGKRGLLLVVLYVSLFGPLLWWAWRTYAPASTGQA